MAYGIYLRVAWRTVFPFVEGAHGNKILESLSRARVGIPRKLIPFPFRNQEAIDGSGAHGREIRQERFGNPEKRIVREQGKDCPEKGDKPLSAEKVEALPQHIQNAEIFRSVFWRTAASRSCFSAVLSHAGFFPLPVLLCRCRAPQKLGGVVAIVSCPGTKLVEDLHFGVL